MCQNPALARAMASDRAMHLRQASRPVSRDCPHAAGDRAAPAVRRAVGWLLVDLGLRLALPPGSTRSRGAINQQPFARQAGHP
jgi:hypothetical protein